MKAQRRVAFATSLAIAAAVVGVSFGVTGPGANSAQAADAPTSTEQHEMTVRADIGLESDLAYVRSIDAQPGLNTTTWSIPVTDAELAELAARNSLAPTVNSVQSALESLPDFAGAWIDTSGYGGVHIALTGGLTSTISNLVSGLVPEGTRIVYSPADYSFSDLQGTDDAISADPLMAPAATPLINSVGVNVTEDRVDVDVSSESVAAELNAKFDSAQLNVTISSGNTTASARDISGGPLYGGEWLLTDSGRANCTMGFADVVNTSGQRYSVTAGHCGSNGTTAYQGTNGEGETIGTGMHDNQSWGKGSTNCDCGFLGPISAAQQTNDTLVNNNAKFAFAQTANAAVNEASCQAGAASYEKNGSQSCGHISTLSNTVNYGTGDDGSPAFTLDHALGWIGIVTSGDSGAPLGDGSKLLGIVSGQNGDGIGWFTQSQYIEAVPTINLQY